VPEDRRDPVTGLADRPQLTVIESLLNELPPHWKRIQLKDALTYIRNGLTVEQNKDRTGYPITRIETITDECVDATRLDTFQEFRLQLLKAIGCKLEISCSATLTASPK